MTERSKSRPGPDHRSGAAKGKDGPDLRGLERRARGSRRAAARRKNDHEDDSAVVTPEKPVSGVRQATGSSSVVSAARRSVDIARLHAALDRMPNCLAICDNELVVSFANRALVRLLRGSQAEIRKLFPGFDAGQLAGSGMDRFHGDPAWFRSQLDASGSLTQSVQLQLGEPGFVVNCSPLLDTDGNRIGTLVEWSQDPPAAGRSV